MRRILLLDLDGVLLQSSGYHETLRRAVDLLAASLGYRSVQLSAETIELFEAAGVTSEWDSAAMCTALLLARAWEVNPELTLPQSFPLPRARFHGLEPPDFSEFARKLGRGVAAGIPALDVAEQLIFSADSRAPDQLQALQSVLRGARSLPNSLTFRLVQELNLGSALFARTYGLPPVLSCPGLLRRHDRAALSRRSRSRLRRWLQRPGHHAAVFTNRPSQPPDGASGPPEAAIGVAAAGVSFLPVVSMGGLAWLSQRRGLEPEAFLKPSPVHALAALLHAIGVPMVPALEAAASLGLDGRGSEAWRPLEGAAVIVFEDSAKGLDSARAAAVHLDRLDIRLDLTLIGVSDRLPKQQALKAAGAHVVPHLEPALQAILALP